MVDESGQTAAAPWKRAVYVAANVLAAIWIAAGTLFFIARFWAAFYHGNKVAIDGFLNRFFPTV